MNKKGKKVIVDENSTVLHIRIPVKVYNILREVADDTGYLPSELARDLIRDGVTKWKFLPSKIKEFEKRVQEAENAAERKTEELIEIIKAKESR